MGPDVRPMTRSRVLRWERVARWNTILFVPITALGLLLIVWSVHGPSAFSYVGLVLAWPWVIAMGPPFGGDVFRAFVSVCAQWVWCLVLGWMCQRVGAWLAALWSRR
jgi:hypothetical protein